MDLVLTRTLGLVLLTVCATACGLSSRSRPQSSLGVLRPGFPGNSDSLPLPPSTSGRGEQKDLSGFAPGDILGHFRNTYYYLVLENDYAGQALDSNLLDIRGGVLARVSAAFKKAIAMEGSGKLKDGRTVNFAAHADDETRYRLTQNPFGDGVGTCVLEPFHTIAVDPRVIPFGTWVKIDETEGMILPDGSVHNGIWRAEDRGAWITNDRIDLFVGAGAGNGKFLEANGIGNLQALTLRLIAPPTDDNCAYRDPPQGR